ncbi:MAG TPA: glycine--tRNA ligase [Candidatus Paceibacterota bacterium]|nr:glycine--tRNA ligase [Candidatus Paceibacterota bacterium]
MEKIVSLCKRRGFVYPGSEIYGGFQGFYDFGPLGVEMKNNLKKLWWNWMTVQHEDIVGIDGAIITNPKVWEASGHVKSFTDPLSECKKCHHRFKVDDLKDKKCPDCGGELTEPKQFNILVPTQLGVIEGEKTDAYLRGEACQTIYLDFKNVLDTSRLKIPFGICQIGKAFRNEVTPGNFLFRQREFEQWDLQWFTHPAEMEKWFEFWKGERMNWYKSLFTHPENLGFHKHEKLAHYAKQAYDIIYTNSPCEIEEVEGIHWRGDWDLSRHSEYSGQDLSYTDPETKEKFIPQIVETSGGVDRMFLFLLIDAYAEEEDRIVLKLNSKVAPYKVAVFPLLRNKPELVEKAREVYQDLKKYFSVVWDDRGNIGKRYYAQDEIGTPYCVTVDFESLEDKAVTVRDRDTMKQERIKIGDLASYFADKLELPC